MAADLGELELLVLDMISRGDGLNDLLSGDFQKRVRSGLEDVRKREHVAVVVARREARRDEMCASARRANLVWQQRARFRALRRAVVAELTAYFPDVPVSVEELRECLDGIPGPLDVRVRSAMVAQLDINKCSDCGEGKPVRAFRCRPLSHPAIRCLDCERAGEDGVQTLLTRQCTGSMARCAKKRREGKDGGQHDISVDFLLNLFAERGGNCALCGRGMTASISSERVERGSRTTWLSGDPDNVSLDQVDPGGGYTMGNVQLVHLRCNLAKRDVDELEFIQMCEDIAAYRGLAQ
jgi:hypothetical protein